MQDCIQDWKEEGTFDHYNGHRIFYRESSQKNAPTIVLLHGFPASSWDWRGVWQALSERYRLIAFDMLGFGFSDKPESYEYSVTEQADILVQLLTARGVRSYTLVAHDFGTLVAQELLKRINMGLKQPDLQALFAISGSILPELSNPRLIQKLLISPLGPLITKLFNQKKLNRSLIRVFGSETLPEGQVLEGYWKLLSYNAGHKQLHRLNFFLKDRVKYGDQWASAWQNAQIPIRYVAGGEDPMYGGEGVEALKRLSNHRDIHTIQKAGHFPHTEYAEQVIDLLDDFMLQSESFREAS